MRKYQRKVVERVEVDGVQLVRNAEARGRGAEERVEVEEALLERDVTQGEGRYGRNFHIWSVTN